MASDNNTRIKANDPDDIANLFNRYFCLYPLFASSLCALFNRSLSLGIVPDDWKLANVVPVFKKGEKDHMENYRPISLLSKVSNHGALRIHRYKRTDNKPYQQCAAWIRIC